MCRGEGRRVRASGNSGHAVAPTCHSPVAYVQILELLLLALASMVWPALLAVVLVALVSPRPVRLLSFFLAGSLLTTVTIGAVIVFLLRGSSLMGDGHPMFSPVVDLVAGASALVLAFALRRRTRPTRPDPPSAPGAQSWYERTVSRGGPLAFAVGVVLNVFPGVFPFVAMKDIAALDYSTAATFGLIVGFYLVMFLPAEVPLVAYLVAPSRTTEVVADLREWLGRNGRTVAVAALTVAGIYLLIRGALKA
jgi:Sap, sulfolipid-1-addressing protein